MKQLLYLSILTFLFSCGQEELETNSQLCTDTDYNVEFNVQLNELVCFPDGNSFQVKTIEDQFCCCLCNCKWEGELKIEIETTENSGHKELFTFGSTTFILGNNIIFNGHVINELSYLYEGESNSLPLCEGDYQASKTELIMRISPE